MKTALLTCLALLLCLVAVAAADVTTIVDGWTITYHVTGEPSSYWMPTGTYMILFPASATYGAVYLEVPPGPGERSNSARFLGLLGEVVLPEGFPQITYQCPSVSNVPGPNAAGCVPLQVTIEPPPPPIVQAPAPPASCGTKLRTVGHLSMVVVGGLPDDGEIIGPFATPALAQRFAQKHCQGDYSIEPLTR